MDLNSLTWLLVTCVFFQMYTTPTLIQSACSSDNATTQVRLLIFNILHFIFSVGGKEVPCNLTQVVYDHSDDILGARMLLKPKEARILKNFIDQPV